MLLFATLVSIQCYWSVYKFSCALKIAANYSRKMTFSGFSR